MKAEVINVSPGLTCGGASFLELPQHIRNRIYWIYILAEKKRSHSNSSLDLGRSVFLTSGKHSDFGQDDRTQDVITSMGLLFVNRQTNEELYRILCGGRNYMVSCSLARDWKCFLLLPSRHLAFMTKLTLTFNGAQLEERQAMMNIWNTLCKSMATSITPGTLSITLSADMHYGTDFAEKVLGFLDLLPRLKHLALYFPVNLLLTKPRSPDNTRVQFNKLLKETTIRKTCTPLLAEKTFPYDKLPFELRDMVLKALCVRSSSRSNSTLTNSGPSSPCIFCCGYCEMSPTHSPYHEHDLVCCCIGRDTYSSSCVCERDMVKTLLATNRETRERTAYIHFSNNIFECYGSELADATQGIGSGFESGLPAGALRYIRRLKVRVRNGVGIADILRFLVTHTDLSRIWVKLVVSEIVTHKPGHWVWNFLDDLRTARQRWGGPERISVVADVQKSDYMPYPYRLIYGPRPDW